MGSFGNAWLFKIQSCTLLEGEKVENTFAVVVDLSTFGPCFWLSISLFA
jgi:hypothetical protein